MNQTTVDPPAGLVAIQGTRAGTVYYLTSNVTTIGRALGNDIQLDDRGVAPYHASIRRRSNAETGVFQIYDLSRSAGVQVNGETITMRHPLSHADRITIGVAVLEFFTRDE